MQVVEAEVGGMYGGCGSWPLYVSSRVCIHLPIYPHTVCRVLGILLTDLVGGDFRCRYVGDGIINYYEEDVELGLPRGLTWLLQNAPDTMRGVLTNHQVRAMGCHACV